jgi:hypothetical protein
MGVKELIAKAKAEAEAVQPAVASVLLGGELVDIAFGRVAGHVWADLTAICPPRPGSTLDGNVGFNSDRVARVYPLDCILVAGEPLIDDDGEFDKATWNEIIDVLPSPSIKLIATQLWALNQNDPLKRIAELGKARTSAPKRKRSSPAK